MYLMEMKKIQEIFNWKFAKEQENLKNKLTEQDYLLILDFQLKSNLFLYEDVLINTTNIYDYLYYRIFEDFLNKYRWNVFDDDAFTHELPMYTDMYTKYTLKALLKNESWKFFFTYLNRWVNKFLHEYFKKSKNSPANSIQANADLLADEEDYHKKTKAKITIMNIIKYIESKIYLKETNKLKKKINILKEKNENDEEISIKDIKKVLDLLPKEIMEEIKIMLIS